MASRHRSNTLLTADLSNLNLKTDEYTSTDQIQIGNGKFLVISHIGSSQFLTSNKNFLLNDILHVPAISKNLLSVQQFAKDNNVFFEFHANHFLIKDCSSQMVLTPCNHKGLYSMQPPSHSSYPWGLLGAHVSLKDWHRHLGHSTYPTMSKVVFRFHLPLSFNKRDLVCSECQMAKSHNFPFVASTSKSSKPLDLIFTNVWGPSSTISHSGCRYYISFIDDFSKFIWLFPIKPRYDVMSIFLQFKVLVERQVNLQIKSIQSDCGGEYHRLQ